MKNNFLAALLITILCMFSFNASAAWENLNRPKGHTKKDLVKQAKDLEAVLISVMVEPMFPDGKDSDLYGGGAGSGIYRNMMIEQYGKIMSQAGGIGIADNIVKQLEKE